MTFLERFSIEHYVDCHRFDSVLQPWERKAVENGKVSISEIEDEMRIKDSEEQYQI